MGTDIPGARLALGLLALGASMLIAGCGADDAMFPRDSRAVVASSDVGTGSTRLLVGAVGPDGQRLGSPSDRVAFAIAPADEPDVKRTFDATWTWIFEPVIGLWRADVDLPAEGQWLVSVVPEVGPPTDPAPFVARSRTIAPNIGEPAPAPQTPTTADAPLSSLTTDSDPDERFYLESLGDVVASERSAVAVFATPAYCASAACGPLLDITKGVAPEFPGITFIHVEVYTGFDEPGFTPGPDNLAPSLGPDYWNLPTEPWVFVIDEGMVSARFEGVMAAEELREALQDL